ncbi:MAG: adenylyltransferase/cytidyltransferase family protein [bacterium]|nr:adenylyltransferase/cytidyltransferase family protein [bacterium]
MKKVIAFGTFDLLHPGHVHMLKEAKTYGDWLTVVIAKDLTVSEVKGHLPTNNELERLAAVTNLNLADRVVLGNIHDKYAVIVEEKPDVVALGYDQNAFIDNLKPNLEPHVRVVRLTPYFPEKYKSSLMK